MPKDEVHGHLVCPETCVDEATWAGVPLEYVLDLAGMHGGAKGIKLIGADEYSWHHHEAEDEFFMVIKGQMVIKLPDQDVSLEAGEFFVVPRGVEHKPMAEEEAHVLMFEPEATLNTGNVQSERTVEKPETI